MILSTLISLTLLHVTLSVNAHSSIIEQTHTADQVGIQLLTDGRTFYVIKTNQNHYLVLNTDEVIAQSFEFEVGTAKLLTKESDLWGEIKHNSKSDKLYLIEDIEIISIPSKINGKCFRSYSKTKKRLPCEDKKPAK